MPSNLHAGRNAETSHEAGTPGPLRARRRVSLPLRDAWQGRSICTHCSHVFVDFYRLRDHINKHTCPRFDPAQESIVPIINRPDLKMHLRHKSVPGLLLNCSIDQ